MLRRLHFSALNILYRTLWLGSLTILLCNVVACAPASPTPTPTPIPFTSTPTELPTTTPTLTRGPASPTATATATWTPIPPTRTATATRTPTPTATLPAPNPLYPLLTVHIQAIQVMDDDGKRLTPITVEQIRQWIDRANRVWSVASIRLLFDPTVDFTTLKSTLMNNMTLPTDPNWLEASRFGGEIVKRYPGKIVVFFRYTNFPDSNNKGGYGVLDYNFFLMPAFNTWICSQQNQNINMFAHELGHLLGLPHTHSRVSKSRDEAVAYLKEHNNDPQVFDGDGFTDTPPDPYIEPEMTCKTDTTIALNQIDFILPRSNLMSYYYNGNNPGTMTPQQIERARQVFLFLQRNGMTRGVNSKVPDAIEFEALPIKSKANLSAGEQKMDGWGPWWSNDRQLFFTANQDSTVTFAFIVDKPGRYGLNLYATMTPDFGQIQTFVDGNAVGAPIDLYWHTVAPTGKISVGEIDLGAGTHDLQFRVVGKNERSTRYSIGLDAFTLTLKP